LAFRRVQDSPPAGFVLPLLLVEGDGDLVQVGMVIPRVHV
jgi:hypothetical protein